MASTVQWTSVLQPLLSGNEATPSFGGSGGRLGTRTPPLFSSNRPPLKSQLEKGGLPPLSVVMRWHPHFLCWGGIWAHLLNPSLTKDLGSQSTITKNADFNKKITHHTKNQEDFNLNEKRQPADDKTDWQRCENYLTKTLKQPRNHASTSDWKQVETNKNR